MEICAVKRNSSCFFCVEKNEKVSREGEKLCMSFVYLENAFDKKSFGIGNEKEIPEMMVEAVMSLYKNATIKIKV